MRELCLAYETVEEVTDLALLLYVKTSTGHCELRNQEDCTGRCWHIGHTGGLLMLVLRRAHDLSSDQCNWRQTFASDTHQREMLSRKGEL